MRLRLSQPVSLGEDWRTVIPAGSLVEVVGYVGSTRCRVVRRFFAFNVNTDNLEPTHHLEALAYVGSIDA